MRISILLVILSVAVYAQGFNFSVGYTGFNLSQQKAEFENVVKTFNSLNQGLHVPIQKNYPNNVFLGFSFTWDVASDIFMDLNMVLARTNAYALYKDALGSIDFRGKFNTALFGTAIRKKILNDSLNIISLGGTVSYGSFTQSIDASILYPNFPDNNRTAYQSYGGQLLCFEPHFEFEHKLYSIIWGRLHVGYRIGKTLKKQNDDDMIPEQFRVQEEATPKVNPDGFVISLGFVLKRL